MRFSASKTQSKFPSELINRRVNYGLKMQSYSPSNCKQLQRKIFQSINQEQSTGVDDWAKTSFAHHPRTEKQGIRIYRSINTEVTTVDWLLADCSGED
jgi:hypothetical protein